MNLDEFKEIEKEFVDYFGERNVPAEYTKRLYEMVIELPKADFSSIVRQAIDNSTRLPNLAQVRQYAKPYLDSFARSQKANSYHSCEKCGGGRFLYTMLREMPHIEVVFICSYCDQEPDNKIAMWNDAYKDTHIPFNPWRLDSHEKAIEVQKKSREKSIKENNFFPMGLKDKPRKKVTSDNFNPAYKALKSASVKDLTPKDRGRR